MFVDLANGADRVTMSQRREKKKGKVAALLLLMKIPELAQVGFAPGSILNIWAQASMIRHLPGQMVQLKRGRVWRDAEMTDFANSYRPDLVAQAAEKFGLAIVY